MKDKALTVIRNDLPEKETILRLWLEQVPSEVTRLNYEYKLKKFIEKTKLDPFTVSSFQIDEYLKRALSKGVNVGTLRGQLTVLNSFYRYVRQKKPDFQSPVKSISVKLPDMKSDCAIKIRKRALSGELIAQVLKQFNEIEERTGEEPNGAFLFRFLLNTGLRISEALSLEYYDENKESGDYINYVKIAGERGYVYVLGKGRRPREFHLNKTFTDYLIQHDPEPGERVIRNQRGKPLSSNGALYLMKFLQRKYFKGAGIFKFSNHSLRHTYITMQLKRNESPINVAKTVGNSVAIIEKTYLSEAKDINEGFCCI